MSGHNGPRKVVKYKHTYQIVVEGKTDTQHPDRASIAEGGTAQILRTLPQLLSRDGANVSITKVSSERSIQLNEEDALRVNI